jgi:hypothetical protein
MFAKRHFIQIKITSALLKLKALHEPQQLIKPIIKEVFLFVTLIFPRGVPVFVSIIVNLSQ